MRDWSKTKDHVGVSSGRWRRAGKAAGLRSDRPEAKGNGKRAICGLAFRKP